MHALVPLPVAVPLLVAALLAGANAVVPRAVTDATALACALAVTVMCAVLAGHSGGAIVYWFSGFHPHRGVAVGVSFTVDRLGAGMATLCALMVSASLVFSIRYFEEIGSLFASLMLVFLAAMVGFCLTGDLFNLFVFFELMSVAAYALTAYKIEEAGPLQGAINFAITNSVGSFCILTGIALLYGRTGALNMAAIGNALAGHPADGLVRVALLLIMGGLLVKAAVVPLHFWLADAHAVAPTPVCVLFSSVMVELGLFGLARVYWTVMAGPMASHAGGLRATLIGLGVLTTLVGGVMCVAQRHIKRLLAFSTVSHSGAFLIGLALLTPAGLAAIAIYVVAHALLKGALFMSSGILLHRFASVDEYELRGRGRGRDVGLRVAAAVFVLGGLGLAALPPLGAFYGKSLLDGALGGGGYGWVIAALVVSSALTAGALLRVAGRVFAGLGPRTPRHHELLTVVSEHPETFSPHDRTPAVMTVPPALLLLAGLAVCLVAPLRAAITRGAIAFTDRAAYAAHVLGAAPATTRGAAVARGAEAAMAVHATVTPGDYLLGLATVVAALIVAAAGLAARPLAVRGLFTSGRPTAALVWLRRLHSGAVTDYVTWLVVGLAVIGGALALV